MKTKSIKWNTFFRCPRCGSEWHPDDSPDVGSITVYIGEDGVKYHSEFCADPVAYEAERIRCNELSQQRYDRGSRFGDERKYDREIPVDEDFIMPTGAVSRSTCPPFIKKMVRESNIKRHANFMVGHLVGCVCNKCDFEYQQILLNE